MAEYYDFDTNVNDNISFKKQKERKESFIETKTGLAKVFLLMFLGLLVTAIIATGLPYILVAMGFSPTGTIVTYLGLLIASMVSLLVLTFVARFVCIKKEKGGTLVFILYSVAMGVLMSTFVISYDIALIGYAFLCAAGSFGIMALYGIISKGSMKVMGYIGFGLLGATLLMGLMYLILSLFGIYYDAIYWLICIFGIVAMLAFTAFDVNNAKRAAESGSLTNNLAAYFALQLYTDFIYLFIRILALLSRFTKRN